MKFRSELSLVLAVAFFAASAAEARGPLARQWLIYPSRAMDGCRAGTASETYAHRCDDLLGAYGRELEACMRFRSSGPINAEAQISLEQSSPECARAAAKLAAESVK